jgi:hypothetical protein
MNRLVAQKAEVYNLSTPSLGITASTNIATASLTASASFNSLSRDHGIG